METEILTIGQVARKAGVGIDTIRFYERQGLIKEPPRRESGYRQYSGDVVIRLRFIRKAKELGFSLKEIEELLVLRVDAKSKCADVKKRAETKISDIESKIRTLRRMKSALLQLKEACSGKGSILECPILDALEREER